MRLGRARRVDESAFDALYVSVWSKAVASARRIVGDQAVAEELAQEAFTRAFERWPTVAEHPSPTAWVLRVTINLAIGDKRRRRLPLGVETAAAHDDHVVLGVVVRDALAKLPEKQREAIVLRYIAGCEEAEIAAVMKIAPGTVKTHLSRGRDRLADLLGQDADELVVPAPQ